METIAVLLMAYGSPDRLEDMGAYLLDIRGGRPTTPELVEEISQRYARIGGRSPLLDITRGQAAALEAELNRRMDGSEIRFHTYVGMRHWDPRIQSAVEQMARDGIRKVIGLVMAPHQSLMSTGAYYRKLEEAIAQQGNGMQLVRIESWHDAPGLISALAEHAQAALDKMPANPYVLFTAHSLPVRILKQGDPYDGQLRETAALVADRLGLTEGRWQFCYQSAGQSQEPWLGPSVYTMIKDLTGAGEKNILAIPVGFMCDHVEILYDLDIEARRIAEEHGACLVRSESLNLSPTFIAGLADVVWNHADPLLRN